MVFIKMFPTKFLVFALVTVTLIGAGCQAAKLGEPCDTSLNPCVVDHSVCVADGSGVQRCTCDTGFIDVEVTPGSNICLPTRIELQQECTFDVQCTTEIPNSKCSDTQNPAVKVCLCDTNYYQDGASACSEKIEFGQPCEHGGQCLVENSECVNNGTDEKDKLPIIICMCKNGFMHSQDRTTCLAKVAEIGQACTVKGQCKPENSECTGSGTNMKCSCLEDHIPSAANTTCLKLAILGDECAEDTQCTVNTTSCHQFEKVCSCPAGFVGNGKNDTCLPMMKLDEACTEITQCSATIANSTCNAEKKCGCAEGHSQADGKCESGAGQFRLNFLLASILIVAKFTL